MASPSPAVSLTSMQQDMETFKSQMLDMMATAMAANAGSPATRMPAPKAAAPVRTLAAPQRVATPPVLQRPAAMPVAARPQPMARPTLAAVSAQPVAVRAASKPANVCGAKSPNGPCGKCAGPFNAMLHYSLDCCIPLDGKGELDFANPKGRQFVGICADEKYLGNVLLIGFGKDAINLRAHNFAALAYAMGTALEHVETALTAYGLAKLLEPPTAASE